MAKTPVRDLNIVIISAPDIAAARTFYGETLGLHVESETPSFLDITGDEGQGAHLGVTAGRVVSQPSEGGPEIWFRVDDTDALYERLKSLDVTITDEPTDNPFGRSLGFLDPAGNHLHAFQPPK
jgi:catechol 2,3-dioxygenase-like lactoylglutathione lyase family enzyme